MRTRDAALAVVGLVAAAADVGADLEGALREGLGRLTAALGARGGALYATEATGPTLVRRATAGDAGSAPPLIRRADAPRLVERLGAGEVVASGRSGADGAELERLGLAPGALVPARAGGQTVGVLALALPAGRDLSPDEGAALEAAGQALALGLRNAQLFASLQERARELNRQVPQLIALTEVARGGAGALERKELLGLILGEARRLVRADVALLLLPGPDGALAPAAAQPEEASLSASAEAALAGLARGGGVWASGPEALVSVPAPGPGAGGALALGRRGDEPFGEDDLERLRGLAGQAGIALANARLAEDLRHEQAERGALAASLVLAQEEERRRVAEDIHDGPVQELAGLALALDALAAEMRRAAPGRAGDADRAAARARDAVRALREAIFDLHPMTLEELGFAAAVRTLAQRLEWRGIDVSVDVRAADGLAGARRTAAFRAVQEAIANVIRHADASRVRVLARREGGEVLLEVADDGRGFDPARSQEGIGMGHLGLAAVRERVAMVGGRLELEAAEGRGTTFRIALPAGPEDPVPGRRGQPEGGGGSRSSAAPSASASGKRSSTTS